MNVSRVATGVLAGARNARAEEANGGRRTEGRVALETQVRDLERLHEVTMRIARTGDRETAMAGVLEAVLAAVGATKGLLSLAEDDGRRLRAASAVGFSGEFLREWGVMATNVGPCGTALARRERVVIEDVRSDPLGAGMGAAVRLGGFAACHSVPLLTHDGELIGVLTAHFAQPHRPDMREKRLMDLYARMAADLIARDRVVARLRESEERFRTLASHAPVGIFLSNPRGETVFVNRCWSEMAGMSQESARGRGWLQAVHPDDRRNIAAGWERAVRENTESEGSFRFRRPDGKITWLHGRAVPLHDREGNPAGFLGTVADVSADRRAESEIRASEGRYRELTQNLPVAVYTTDAEGRVKLFNAAAVELWGREPKAGEGWCGSAKMHTLDGAELPLDRCPMAVALKEGRALDGIEAIVERPNGEWRYVLANPHPFFDEEGRVTGGVNVLLDITERRRADDARARLGAIVESSEDAIVSKNLDGIILSWNAGAERLFGYTAEEAIGRPITMLIPPDRPDEEPSILARIRAGERIRHFETVRRRKDGRLLDISLTVSPVRDGHGRIVGASKIARDITERKQAEAELRRREQVYRAIGESVDYGIWVSDAEGQNIYLSDSFLKLVGMTQEQCAGFGWEKALAPGEAAGAMAAWQECMRTGTSFWEREYHVIGQDGKAHPVLARGAPVRDDDGRIVYWAGINLDIAAFKDAEEALRRGQQQLRLVTDNAIVFLAQIDREHRLKFVNRPYAARFGLEPEAAIGRHVRDVVGAAAYAAFKPQIDAAMAGDRVEFEMEIPYERFGRRWVRVIHEPERNAGGEVVGLVAVISDITARKQSEREMEQARDRAVAAARAKDDFLAALSHELRTPLNPVLLLASEAADDPELPERVRGDFATIRKNVELEARLIDDLLDLTRITRGKLSLNFAAQDVHTILQDVLATLRPEFEQKRLTVNFELRAKAPIVWGDAVRLQQVLWNVLKNAVKFTAEAGAVTVRTGETDEAVLIEVTDSGIGMTEAEIARAFDSFSQGDHAESGRPHRFGGVGLGLAISRMLVELHSGSIRATSPGRGQGATFEIVLPRAAAEHTGAQVPETAHTPTKVPAGDIRPKARGLILLVEDHEPTRAALAQLLRRRQYEVLTAGSVQEARQAATAGGIGLLISDVGLPDGNGYELMREMRERHKLKGIALTGYGMDHDVVRSQAAGFVVHLTKPVTVQALDKALAEVGKDLAGA